MAEEKKGPTVHYFGLKGRGFAAFVGAAYWGKQLHWEKYSFDDWKNNKNDIKSRCPFDQLPILVDGSIVCPQSMAILRYVGKKWGKEGSNLKVMGKNEMLIEESNDILQCITDAKWGKGNDTREAFLNAFKKISKHYDNLEKLLTNGKFLDEVLTGDMALFHVINMVHDLDPDTFQNHHALETWYNAIANHDGVKALLEETGPNPMLKMPQDRFTLFSIDISQPSRSVWLLADACGLPYDYHAVEFGTTKSPEFLKINPAGQVPAISHDGFILAEGAAILTYLAEYYQAASDWFPTDPNIRAKVNKWLHWHHSNTRDFTISLLRPALHGHPADAQGFVKGKMVKILTRLNDALKGKNSYLASVGTPTVADLMVLCEIDQLFFIEPIHKFLGSFLDSFPNIERWLKSMKNHLNSLVPGKKVYDENVKAALNCLRELQQKIKPKPPTLHYFHVKARSFDSLVGAAYWGKELHWETYSFEEWANNKNDIKSKLPFGQVPFLVDGDVEVAQSNAIARYLAKKWGKYGANIREFGMTDMLIEESRDMFSLMVAAKYGNGDTLEAWEKCVFNKLPKHYDNLEKLLLKHRGGLGKFTPEILMGDISLFHVINILHDLDANTLKNHNALKAWYDGIANHPEVKALLKRAPIYFKLPEEKESPLIMYYFGFKARGFAVPVAAAYFGLSSDEFRWEKESKENWPNRKKELASHLSAGWMGQLPVLNDGNRWISQSMAITRYASKKWGLEGDNLKDFSISELLIEEAHDLFEILYEAYKTKSFEKQLVKFSKQLDYLEKLMTQGKFASEKVMGDFCLFASINTAHDNDPSILDKYKNLKAWYNEIANNDDVKALLKDTSKIF